jgi:hypothetical protein
MYYSLQTLVNRKTKELVRIVPDKENNSFYWPTSSKTKFINEQGKTFFDKLDNYTCVKDVFGRPIPGKVNEKGLPDLSLKKYLVSPEKRQEMKNRAVDIWEKQILERMDGINLESSDIYRKRVYCPFSDGSYCKEMKEIFMNRRKARPLFRIWSEHENEFIKGAEIFKYKEQYWTFQKIFGLIVILPNKNLF